jgi:hypothetical protein
MYIDQAISVPDMFRESRAEAAPGGLRLHMPSRASG